MDAIDYLSSLGMNSQDSHTTTATSTTPEDAPLNEAGFDVRLARLIQQQELSFMMLAQGTSPPNSEESYGSVGSSGARHQALEDFAAFARVLRPSFSFMLGGNRSHSVAEDYYSDDALDPDRMTYEELRALGDTVGSVSKGLCPSIMRSIPTRQYSKARNSDHGEEQCTICRCEFEEKVVVKVLPCDHCFHPACIDQWLEISKKCPICSSEVDLNSHKS